MGEGKLSIELGWPAKALWSNGSHSNYFAVARCRKAARREAYYATRSEMPEGWQIDGEIPVHIIAHPKTARFPDKQNVISGLKSHFDGIADALKVDDARFAAPTLAFAEPVKGGSITVEIGGEE